MIASTVTSVIYFFNLKPQKLRKDWKFFANCCTLNLISKISTEGFFCVVITDLHGQCLVIFCGENSWNRATGEKRTKMEWYRNESQNISIGIVKWMEVIHWVNVKYSDLSCWDIIIYITIRGVFRRFCFQYRLGGRLSWMSFSRFSSVRPTNNEKLSHDRLFHVIFNSSFTVIVQIYSIAPESLITFLNEI
jgi:hypothetical protein